MQDKKEKSPETKAQEEQTRIFELLQHKDRVERDNALTQLEDQQEFLNESNSWVELVKSNFRKSDQKSLYYQFFARQFMLEEISSDMLE